jgi:hypothetical protein
VSRGFSRYEFLALDATLLHIHHEQEDSAEEPATKNKNKLESRGDRLEVEGAHRPNRNVNGMLSLFPEADIIASETNGPMNAEVLPIYRILPQRMTHVYDRVGLLPRRTGQRKGTCIGVHILGSRHRAEQKRKNEHLRKR